MPQIQISSTPSINFRSTVMLGRKGCRWRHIRIRDLVSSCCRRAISEASSSKFRIVNRARREYSVALRDRDCCVARYDVNDKSSPNGVSPAEDGLARININEKTLFACENS